jgi:hypothetical protein
VYFDPALREGTGRLSFNPLHWDLYQQALQWTLPRTERHVYIAPRGAAKSTLLLRILPIWLVAHGHRRFPLLFSFTKQMIGTHWGNLRDSLTYNDALLRDFPELKPVRSTQTEIRTKGGAFAARALGGRSGGGTMAGLQVNNLRPDFLAGDDLEPFEVDHSRGLKAQIESKIVTEVLPLGSADAVTVLAGTTTMDGSLIHDAVKHARGEATAPWIADNDFRCHWYPAIYHEGTEEERSMWPERWKLTDTHLGDWKRGTREFWLNMMNYPDGAPSRGYWRRDMFRYRTDLQIVRRLIYMDVAMTTNSRSDKSALVVLGLDAGGRRAVVEHALMGRFTDRQLGDYARQLTASVPGSLKEWYVESNQGGETWRRLLAPIPPGVTLELEHVSGRKRDRIDAALVHYREGRVFHARPLEALENQACDWTPAAKDDDLLDALAGALRWAFPSTVAAA